jgi:hypothetical protein
VNFQKLSSDRNFRVFLVFVSEEGDGKYSPYSSWRGEAKGSSYSISEEEKKQPSYFHFLGRRSKRMSLNSRRLGSRKSQAILSLDDDRQVILLGRKISDNKTRQRKSGYSVSLSFFKCVVGRKNLQGELGKVGRFGCNLHGLLGGI